MEPIFLSLSHCASLHPSQFDTVDGMSDDEGIYSNDFNPATFVPFTGEDGEELSAVGRVRSDFAKPQTRERFAPY